MRTIASLLMILSSISVGYAGDVSVAALMKAIDDYCASQGQDGFLSGSVCHHKVMDGLKTGDCGLYVKSETLGTYIIDCK